MLDIFIPYHLFVCLFLSFSCSVFVLALFNMFDDGLIVIITTFLPYCFYGRINVVIFLHNSYDINYDEFISINDGHCHKFLYHQSYIIFLYICNVKLSSNVYNCDIQLKGIACNCRLICDLNYWEHDGNGVRYCLAC